jgi:hypothetical protein
MSYSLRRATTFLLIILPILFFYWVVVYMSANAPFQDDFDALFEPTVLLSKGTESIWSFWNVLFTQDDERRIVMDRLIAFMLYKTTGQLDLRVMIILGACTLLVYFAVIARTFKEAGIPLVFLLPIPWLLFNVQYFDAVFWSMIPLQHIAVFVWGLVALWLITREKKGTLLWGMIFAFLSICSDVSGNFILPAGILVLFIQRRWSALAVWIVAIGLFVFYYFHGLSVPEFRPSFSDNISKPLNILMTILALPGLWADPGPSFGFGVRAAVSMIIGFILIVTLISLAYRTGKRIWKSNYRPGRNELFVWGGLCFLAIIFSTLALARASYGLDSVFNTRYRHMYIHWLILVYTLLLIRFPEWRRSERIGWVTGALAVLFCFNAYIQYWVDLDYFRKVILTDAYEWKNNRALPSAPIYQTPRIGKVVDKIYEDAYQTGVYRGPEYQFGDVLVAQVKGTAEVEIMDSPESLVVNVLDLTRSMGRNDGFYVILRSESETHIFPTRHNRRAVHRMLVSGQYYYPGATSEVISKVYLKSRPISIEIGVVDGSDVYRLTTGKQVNL